MTASIKKILCPVDFSECSLDALRHSIELAQHLGAELHVLHVYEVHHYVRPDLTIWTYTGETRPLTELAKEQAIGDMDNLAKSHAEVDLEIGWHVEEGDPIETIVEESNAGRYDMIVMGTHGRTGLSHLLLGSVAERVVRSASCPVLTYRTKKHAA